MSSRILEAGTPVEPVRWALAPGTTAASAARTGPGDAVPYLPEGAASGRSGSNVEPAADERVAERTRALEARIRELERDVAETQVAARAQGHREGLAEGAREEAARWAGPQQQLAEAIASMAAARPRFRAEVEADAVKLALAVAAKILNRELAVDPEALHGLIRVAMGKLNQRELLSVRVHPLDAPAVQRLLSSMNAPPRVTVEGDTTLERGAAVFETERGALDASVTSQLEEIERGLTDLVAGGGPR